MKKVEGGLDKFSQAYKKFGAQVGAGGLDKFSKVYKQLSAQVCCG